VAGLQHHPDLGRVRLQGRDLGDELVDRGWAVLDPAELDHPSAGRPRATRWNASAQSIPTPSTMPPLQDHRQGRRGAVLMDQSSQDDTLVGVGPPGPSPWDAVSRQSSRDKLRKRSQEEAHEQGG
jgi:hypothetical protein